MLNWYYSNIALYQGNLYSNYLQVCLSNLFITYGILPAVVTTILYFFYKKNIILFFVLILYVYDVVLVDFIGTLSPNIGLVNSLSFFHPFSFFITVVLFIGAFFFKVSYLYAALLADTVFILLGSWWSSQELLWYGWWNWDGVESSLLILVIVLFMYTHIFIDRRNIFITVNILISYTLLYFCILNKTNIFKSIHSFSSSTVATMSPIIFMLVIVYFVCTLLKYKFGSLFWYFLIKWSLFYLALIVLFNNIFLNLNFFFYFSIIMLLIVTNTSSIYLITLLCFMFMPYAYAVTLVVAVVIFFKFKCVSLRYVHATIFGVIIVFIYVLIQFKFIYFTLNLRKFIFLENVTLLNNYTVRTKYNKTVSYNHIQTNVAIVYKNYLSRLFGYLSEFTVSPMLMHKNGNGSYLSSKLPTIFLVTKVYYLIQKPRYNYYTSMYVFKSDLLVNQQKQRRTPLKIGKHSWSSKSVFLSKINFFVLSNHLSIDLRLYKLLLRKLKKKLLKFQIKTYVYIVPNNKLSHKSKNSRMGKGKGLNCRFYFRLKKNKPIIIFDNLNHLRFLKIKQFLFKFFNYKFFKC